MVSMVMVPLVARKPAGISMGWDRYAATQIAIDRFGASAPGEVVMHELGITPDGIWLSLNGWCQDHQQGDPFSVGYYGATPAGGNYWDACNSSNSGLDGSSPKDGRHAFDFACG